MDRQPYNENRKAITWEESSLRAWLNGEFINRAFSDEEKENINITEVVNQDNQFCGTEGGNNTADKIFLLSLQEVAPKFDGKEYGFLDYEAINCKTSSFSKMETMYWWLRSPGSDGDTAAVIFDNGWIWADGNTVNYYGVGVRPALHLNLSSSNLFSYAGTVSSDGTENEVPYKTKTRLIQK